MVLRSPYMIMNILSRYRGCLLGLAVGDALGTTLEFFPTRHVHAESDDMICGPAV